MKAKDIDRFFTKVNKQGPLPDQRRKAYRNLGRCWDWTGSQTSKGYGCFRGATGVTSRAHRVSYEMHIGGIPTGMHVCHRCDNPGCVNPDHLWTGTNLDNRTDMRVKRRGATGNRHSSVTHPELLRRGSAHPQAKLTEAQVKLMRDLYASGTWKHDHLSEKFGVSGALVCLILNRKRWAHVA